jgi:NAD dependent epimerase/dehydratase family enzyme
MTTNNDETKIKILVTGGTGFIGSALTKCLLNNSYHVTVLSRATFSSVKSVCGTEVDVLGSFDQIEADDFYNIVINLAGTPILVLDGLIIEKIYLEIVELS